jgi:hypothetical protein
MITLKARKSVLLRVFLRPWVNQMSGSISGHERKCGVWIAECGINAREGNMANVAMILKRSPYGDINAAEAVRHALGAVSFEISVNLILVDGGVLLAKKGQDDSGTGFTNLEATLKDCLDMGVVV